MLILSLIHCHRCMENWKQNAYRTMYVTRERNNTFVENKNKKLGQCVSVGCLDLKLLSRFKKQEAEKQGAWRCVKENEEMW